MNENWVCGSADRGEVKAFTDWLLDQYEAYFKKHADDNGGEGVSFEVGFMAAHNFHRIIVEDLVERTNQPLLIKVAVDTFAVALGVRELYKELEAEYEL